MSNNIIEVPLELIINAVEMASKVWKQYLDIETMVIVSIPQFDDGSYEEYALFLSIEICFYKNFTKKQKRTEQKIRIKVSSIRCA